MITVHKLNHLGQEKVKYSGEVLELTGHQIILEAHFALPDKDAGYVVFANGDRFIEYFYSDRWYNIFMMFSGATGVLKGWYCNITRPAKLTPTDIWADDLALDVFVQPTGEQLVLDEDEFAELGLGETEQAQARAALVELQQMAREQQGPFAKSEVEKFRA